MADPSIFNSPLNTNSTNIGVSWSNVDPIINPSVRVDMYLTSDLAKQKPGTLPPVTKANNKGGIDTPSIPPISSATGFPLIFTGLTAGTSYTFFLYGWQSDPGTSGSSPLPILLAQSSPISTLAASAPTPPPKKPQPTPDYPVFTPQLFPKDLNNTNRVVITLDNNQLFVQWYVTLDGVADHNSIGPLGSYRFATFPGQSFSVSLSGKLISTGEYTNSPTQNKVAGKNSYHVKVFLSDSGVNGLNGIRQFVESSKSTSVRNMLGI
jgi:hypothetical protein